MTHPNDILLYVRNPEASGKFYANLLGCEPVESSETFAMFALRTGMMLGLWRHDEVLPSPMFPGGGNEIGWRVKDDEELDKLHADWTSRGVPVAMKPTMLDFGRSFVVVDPDGHRLRVYALAEH